MTGALRKHLDVLKVWVTAGARSLTTDSLQSSSQRGWRKSNLLPLESALIGLLVLALFVGLNLARPQIMESLTLALFDSYQRAQPREPQAAPIRIIDIDEESLDRLGQWPWPRTQIANLVDKTSQAGAAAIGFDIVFAEPDRTSPQRIARILASNPSATQNFEDLKALQDHDDILAESFGRAKVVGGTILTHTLDMTRPNVRTGFAYSGSPPLEHLQKYRGFINNIPVLDDNLSGLGSISIVRDRDRVIRRVQLISAIEDTVVPSLALETLRVATGAQTILIKSSDSNAEAPSTTPHVTSVKVGPYTIPTNETGEVWLHYSKEVPSRVVPAYRLIEGDLSAEEMRDLFEGVIVLVGTTSAGLRDVVATPLEAYKHGVFVHAQAIEQMVHNSFLRRPSWVIGAELVGLISLGVLLGVLLPLLGPMWGAGLSLGLLSLTALTSWTAFSSASLLVNPIYIMFGLISMYLALTWWQYFRTEQERAAVRAAFSRYLSPEMVERIARDPSQLRLGGETRELTVLFSDIRDFSSFSENMSPEDLTSLLNRFHTPMTDAVLSHQATVDKYIGDSIMAFWNAPLSIADHPGQAAEAALEMVKRLATVNRSLSSSRIAGRPKDLRIGVGLNTGDCCVGNLGSEQHFSYSALGDAVNLASRLEGLTKQYGLEILVGSTTAEQLSDYALIELDLIRVVGRQAPERIFALVGSKDVAQGASFAALREQVERALALYRSQNWDEARDAFTQAKRKLTGTINVGLYIDVMIARIENYKTSPPGADWDGVHTATEK